MNPLTLSFAYKFGAFALMLMEVKSFCGRTGLPAGRVYTHSDIMEGSHVGPATLPEVNGSILTDKYFFGFGRGHLANFYNRGFKANTDAAIQARNVELSKLQSLVDTNGAYALATNWLNAAGVNVAAVEAKYRRTINQWRFYPEGLEKPSAPLAVYQVEWRGSIFRTSARETAVVSVTVLGATKEIMEHHILDDSLFQSPALRIADGKGLLAIPDQDFQKYSATQKSNLVAKFAFTNGEPKRLVSPDGAGEPKKGNSP